MLRQGLTSVVRACRASSTAPAQPARAFAAAASDKKKGKAAKATAPASQMGWNINASDVFSASSPAAVLNNKGVDPLQKMMVEQLKNRRAFIEAALKHPKLQVDTALFFPAPGGKVDAAAADKAKTEWAKAMIALKKEHSIPNALEQEKMVWAMAKARTGEGDAREWVQNAATIAVGELGASGDAFARIATEFDRIEAKHGVPVPCPWVAPAGKAQEAALAEWTSSVGTLVADVKGAELPGVDVSKASDDDVLLATYKAELQSLVDTTAAKGQSRERAFNARIESEFFGKAAESTVPAEVQEALKAAGI